MQTRKPPWEKPAPRKSRPRHLTLAQKTKAKSTARRAGRRYPNLVDNMRAAKSSIEMKPRTKNPQGGLTAAGRAKFKREQGAQLRPGVKKAESEMSPQEMRRKGSWAARFYGRKGKLPPLKKPSGEPSRFALTAAAWGEPIPKSEAAARKIAAKGRRLLQAYKKFKVI